MAHTLQNPYTESSLCGKVGADTSFDDLLCLESEDEFWDNLPGEDSLFDDFSPEPSEPNGAKPVSITEEHWKSMRIPADNRSITLDALPEWYKSRRERLIESMEALGRKLDLAPCTVAHCAAIYDTFMAKNSRQDKLAEEVFCVAALWIAGKTALARRSQPINVLLAKFNESATNAPSADQMLEGLNLKKDLLLKAELYILQGVEWRIQIITVHEALAFLNSIEVSPAPESLSALKHVKGKQGGADKVGGYSEFLADMVMLGLYRFPFKTYNR